MNMSAGSEMQPPKLSTPLVILFFALILNAVGHAFFTMTFPALGRKIGLADFQTGMVLSLSALVMTVAAPIWGAVCERWGRRNVIATGLFAACFFILMLAIVINFRINGAIGLTGGFILVLTTRLLHAATTAGVLPGAQAVVADVTNPQMRVKGMGMLGAAFGLGTLGGGAISVATGSDFIVEGFFAISVLLLIVAVALWKNLPETGLHQKSIQTSSLKLSQVLPSLLVTLIGLAVYSSLQQVTALRLQDSFAMSINDSVRFTGAIMMSSMGAMIFVQSVGISALTWAPQRLMLCGAAIAAAAMLVAAFASSPIVLLLSMMFLGLGLGALLPGNLAILSLSVNAGQQAKVAGINGTCQGIGMALGPLIGVTMHRIAPSSAYLLNAVLLIVIIGLVLWIKARLNTSN